MKIIITGVAGFIGFNLSKNLLDNGFQIIGIDNLNNYYDTKIKFQRLKILKKYKQFNFYKYDLENFKNLSSIFEKNMIQCVINLAAQAGVRYSIKNPREYVNSNVNGFFNILELSRMHNVKKILFASSSSVYGESKSFPLKENDTLNPKNFYGLTKKNNEEMAKIYSNLYNMNIYGLRFFTVYGEWGRPDMFMLKYLNSKYKFDLYNKGNHYRDFTYISDVIKIISKLIKINKKGFNIYNICNNKPIKITKVLQIINKKISKKNLKINKLGLQKADVVKTHGDNSKIIKATKFKNFTSIETGISNLVKWYKQIY